MQIQQKDQPTPSGLSQSNAPLNQNLEAADVLAKPFSKKNRQTSPELPNQPSSPSQRYFIRELQEEDYSNNILNIGFIADQSRLALSSNSQSVISENLSISVISSIPAHPKRSRVYSHYQGVVAEMSGMEQWSQYSQNLSAKRDFKRFKPEIVEQEQPQIGGQFTKKKKDEKNKVVSLGGSASRLKSEKMSRPVNKSKNSFFEEESSNETIRGLLGNMEFSQKSGKGQKSKTKSKR